MVIDFLSSEAIDELKSFGECDKMSMHYKMVNGEIYRIRREYLGTAAGVPVDIAGFQHVSEVVRI